MAQGQGAREAQHPWRQLRGYDTAPMPDPTSGWIDQPGGASPLQHVAAIATVGLVFVAIQREYHQKLLALLDLWWNGCNMAGGAGSAMAPPAPPARALLPTDMVLRVKQVQQTAAPVEVSAALEDTVDELVGRIEVGVSAPARCRTRPPHRLCCLTGLLRRHVC